MNRTVQFIALLMLVVSVNGQGIRKKVQEAVAGLEADYQLASGMIGFYVVSEKTGEVICNRNGSIGMPVASSQKVLTSIAALELLGGDFRYRTSLQYKGTIGEG